MYLWLSTHAIILHWVFLYSLMTSLKSFHFQISKFFSICSAVEVVFRQIFRTWSGKYRSIVRPHVHMHDMRALSNETIPSSITPQKIKLRMFWIFLLWFVYDLIRGEKKKERKENILFKIFFRNPALVTFSYKLHEIWSEIRFFFLGKRNLYINIRRKKTDRACSFVKIF